MIDVILWSNGNIMVFDEKGNQVNELQGSFRESRERLKGMAEDINGVKIGCWTTKESIKIPKEHFFCECWD